jgi:hypothetical protein
MVNLPRLTGPAAITLGQQLLTAAKDKAGAALPTFIERPRARLESAVSGLVAAAAPKEMGDSKAAKNADRQVDAAWRAFFHWLESLIHLPDNQAEGLDKARTLYNLCFSKGLSFIIISYREEWAESEARLKSVADGGYEPIVTTLGGAPLLSNLKSAHVRYGEALGVKATLVERATPEVRKKMDALASAMKIYIAKAATWADPEEPGSEALSKALLAPFINWKDIPFRSKGGADETVDGGDTVGA